VSVDWSSAAVHDEGQPESWAVRSEVGPIHTIYEVAEGNEVMEKRGRLGEIMHETAKGQIQGWLPSLPHLVRVNAAARRSGQIQFTALLHHVDVAALERALKRIRRAASAGIDGVTVEMYSQNWLCCTNNVALSEFP
jgi:hypothetical protein